MSPDLSTPAGAMKAREAELLRFAENQDKMAKDHDRLAAECRATAAGYRQQAAKFTAAAKAVAA